MSKKLWSWNQLRFVISAFKPPAGAHVHLYFGQPNRYSLAIVKIRTEEQEAAARGPACNENFFFTDQMPLDEITCNLNKISVFFIQQHHACFHDMQERLNYQKMTASYFDGLMGVVRRHGLKIRQESENSFSEQFLNWIQNGGQA